MVIYYCYVDEFKTMIRDKNIVEGYKNIVEIITKPVKNKMYTFFCICKPGGNPDEIMDYIGAYEDLKELCPSLKCPYYDNVCDSSKEYSCEHPTCISLRGSKRNMVDGLSLILKSHIQVPLEDPFKNYYSISMHDFNSKYFIQNIILFKIEIRTIELIRASNFVDPEFYVYFEATLDDCSQLYQDYVNKNECGSGVNFTSVLDHYKLLTLRCYGFSENTNWNNAIISDNDKLRHYYENSIKFYKYPKSELSTLADNDISSYVVYSIGSDNVIIRTTKMIPTTENIKLIEYY